MEGSEAETSTHKRKRNDSDTTDITDAKKVKESENIVWFSDSEDEVEKERNEEAKRAEGWKQIAGKKSILLTFYCYFKSNSYTILQHNMFIVVLLLLFADFYDFMFRACMIRTEIRVEGLMGSYLRRNLLCLGRSQTYTELMVDYFNKVFPPINAQMVSIEESLLNKSVEQIDMDVLKANLHCLERLMILLGGKTLRDVIGRMKLALQNNDIQLFSDAMQQARNALQKLFKLLQTYFKIGVKMGIPEAKCVMIFSVPVDEKQKCSENLADMNACKAYEVLQKFNKMACGGIETSSNSETLNLLRNLFKNKPTSNPVNEEANEACNKIDRRATRRFSVDARKWDSEAESKYAGFGAWFAQKELDG